VEVTITDVETEVSTSIKTNTAGFSPLDVTGIDVPAGEVIRVDLSLRVNT
jgi:hypothetical protein